jgi:hypothetical protein
MKRLRLLVGVFLLLSGMVFGGDFITYDNGDGTVRISGAAELASISIPETIDGKPVSIITGFWRHPLTTLYTPNAKIDIHGAFQDCTNLTSVSIGGGDIGDGSFGDCYNLKNVTLREGVTSIGSWAFGGCAFTTLHIPGTVTNIAYGAFSSDAFSNIITTDLKRVSFGEGMTSINNQAFSDRHTLTSVTFPSSLKSIGKFSFSACNGLESLDLPSELESIDSSAFNRCAGLSSVAIPHSVTNLGSYAFYECTGLTNVTMGDGLLTGAESAFNYCTNLQRVVVGNNMTNTGRSAFQGCSNLSEIILPDSLRWIDANTFRSCSSLSEINLPSGLTGIGGEAFSGSGVTNIIVPDEVTQMGWGVFYGCSYLKGIRVDAQLAEIPAYTLAGCRSLSALTIGCSVTSIGEYAFSDCTSLEHVRIPCTVTNWGEGMFYGCSNLVSITVYCCDGCEGCSDGGGSFAGPYWIGEWAFSGCDKLEDIYFIGNAPDVSTGAFNELLQPVTIHYLPGTSGWEETFAGQPTVMDSLYTLTVNNGSGSGEYASGRQVDIVANAAPQGSVFDRWIGDSSYVADQSAAMTTVTMPAQNILVTATYRTTPVETSYTVMISCSEGGSVSPTGNVQMVYGESLDIHSIADSGYKLEKWVVDGADDSRKDETLKLINITSNRTVHAIFEKIKAMPWLNLLLE